MAVLLIILLLLNKLKSGEIYCQLIFLLSRVEKLLLMSNFIVYVFKLFINENLSFYNYILKNSYNNYESHDTIETYFFNIMIYSNIAVLSIFIKRRKRQFNATQKSKIYT